MKIFIINGKEAPLLSIIEVSNLVGRSGRLLRLWEKKGIMPKAFHTETMDSPIVGKCERRYYLREQAEVLGWWVAKVEPKRGRFIPTKLRDLLFDKWEEVTQIFIKKLGEE